MMVVRRNFIPGEKWIYMKIYGGSRLLERILVQELFVVLEQLIHQEIAEHYFFIRYADPDYHIRLRVFTNSPENTHPVVSALNAVLADHVDDRSIYGISLNTYNREIERYGKNSIELVEQLFYFDSITILSYLFGTDRQDEHRWLFSMYWIDQFLESLKFSNEKKGQFYESGYQTYVREMGIQKPARVIMDRKYRDLTPDIERMFGKETNEDANWNHIASLVSSYREGVAHILDHLLEKDSRGQLQVGLESLASSIIHMHVNRMFRTRNRKYELLIYHFLTKYHRSRTVRAKMLANLDH